VQAVKRITAQGVHYVMECSGSPGAQRGAGHGQPRRQDCLASYPSEPVLVDLAKLTRNNIYCTVFAARAGARPTAAALMKQKRFDAKLLHTHTSAGGGADRLEVLSERIEDAIKVVVKVHGSERGGVRSRSRNFDVVKCAEK